MKIKLDATTIQTFRDGSVCVILHGIDVTPGRPMGTGVTFQGISADGVLTAYGRAFEELFKWLDLEREERT